MSQKEEIVAQLKEKQKLMILSEDQEELENLFDALCEAGFRNMTMPLFEEELSKRELWRELNQCLADVHKVIKPLGKNILEVSRIVEENEGEKIDCELPYVEQLTKEQVEDLADVLAEYEEAVKTLEGEYREKSWNGVQVKECTEDLKRQIEEAFPKLIQACQELKQFQEEMKPICNDEFPAFHWDNLEVFISILEKALRLQKVPADWIYQSDLDFLLEESRKNMKECLNYMHIRNDISTKYENTLFDLNGEEITYSLLDGIKNLTAMLRIPGKNEGFILDNLRHIAERTDLLLGNLNLLQHDVLLVSELTGCEQAATFENVSAFYQMADFLAHKPAEMKGMLTLTQIQSASEAIRKIRTSYQTAAERQKQLEFRYQDSFFKLDSGFLLDQFGKHSEITKYWMGKKQLYLGDIQTFISEMEQGEALIHTSLEVCSQFDMSAFQIPVVKRVLDIDENLSICKAILGEVNPCEFWLDARNREQLLLEIEDCEQHCLKIQRITYQLMEVHNDKIFQINYEDLMPKFKEDYQGFFKRFKGSYKQDRELVRQTYLAPPENLTDEEIVRVLDTLRSLQEQREVFRKKKEFLAANIGTYYHGENTNWGLLKADIRQFEQVVSYFDSAEDAYASIGAAKASMEVLQQYYGSLMTLRNVVRERAVMFYSGEAFKMTTVEEIRTRFTQMVQKAKKMERDFRNMCTYLKDQTMSGELTEQKISYQEILHGIQSLDKWRRDLKWLEEKEAELNGLFGEDFKGKDTDWEMLSDRLNGMKDMYATVKKGMYGEKLAEFLEDDTKKFTLDQLSVQDYKAMLAKIETELKSFLQVPALEQVTLEEAASNLKRVKEMCMDMDDIFAKVSAKRKRREPAKNVLEDMKQFALMQQIENKFAEDSPTERETYGELYLGVVTDWNAIGDRLKLAKSMRSDVGKYHLSRNFVEALLESEQSNLDIYSALNMLTGASIYKNEFVFASKLFGQEENLAEMEFDKLYEKLSNCLNAMDMLKSWIGYEQGKAKCVKHGLMSFISAIEGRHLEAENIKDSFIKTFYTKWLESVIFRKGGLYPYRVKSYEEIHEILALETEKRDIRTLEIRDYLSALPHWLSRRKTCLLVKDETLMIPIYKKIVLLHE